MLQSILPPKKPLSGYMIFANEIRASVAAEHPELKMVNISTIIGERWAKATAEDKAKFESVSLTHHPHSVFLPTFLSEPFFLRARLCADGGKGQKEVQQREG
jgi:hypothetical protein